MSKDHPKRETKKAKQTGKSKEQSDYKKSGGGIVVPIAPFKKATK